MPTRNPATLTSACILALCLMPHAAAASPPASLHLDFTAGTRLPIDVRGRLQLEVPHRVRIGLHAGWLPPAYVDLINEVATSANWYSEGTGALIAAALDDALVLGLDLGWRPLPEHGFFFDAGYQAALLGGSFTGTELVEEMTGTPMPTVTREPQLAASATVHMMQANIGWEEVLVEHLVLRFSLGGVFTVQSRSEIGPTDRAPRPATEAFYEAGAEELDRWIEGWVHSPTIGVELGYRFF